MTKITLRQLEIFAQVAELGSFRRCAEHLGLSQVAISDHIRTLENRLGQLLFKRVPGAAAKLTPAGEVAYRRVKGVLSGVDDLLDDFGPPRDSAHRRIKLGAHAWIVHDLLGSLHELEQRYPELQIELDMETFTLESFAKASVDIGFSFTLDEPDGPSPTFVRQEPLAIFVAMSHPLTSFDVVTPKDLAGVPMITLSSGHPLRRLVTRALQRFGVPTPAIAIETDDYGLILSSAEQGLGYLCMFANEEREGPRMQGLRRLKLERPLPSLQTRLTVNPSLRRDPVVKEFLADVTNRLRAV
jgi:DNA-binding transcriptional LysR family regulator